MSKLTTRRIVNRQELIEHFDALAPGYADAHGPAAGLLAYRLGIIRRLFGTSRAGTLLEIGCGTAIHLVPLAEGFERAVGIDVSPEMLRVARRHADRAPWSGRISLRVDAAEELATVDDGSVDAALCVGTLEHLLDRQLALRQVHRVLRAGGVFVCLTPNGDYCWYRQIAPRLGLDTRHLSTDRFLGAGELRGLLGEAGLALQHLEHWRFIPSGDLPDGFGPVLEVLEVLDRVGEQLGHASLRGGIAVLAARSAMGRSSPR